MSLKDLAAALKQRAVVQWTAAYLAAAWLMLQLFAILADQFDWPAEVSRSLTVLLGIGVLAVVIVGWYHGEKGSQRATPTELLMLAMVIIIAASALAFVRQSVRQTTSIDEPAGTPIPSPVTSRASIAVLPFANLSGDPKDDYFADGFTEQLIDALANVPELRVASRTSSFAFKSTRADIEEIGRRLGVSSVLEGSVRRAGDRLRVTAQLINAADGFHVWSKTFERESHDVFAVQDELSRELTNSLNVTLGSSRTDAVPTRDMEAYDLYLRGIFHQRQRDPAGADSAVIYLERATRLDPGFAAAYAELGQAYQELNFNEGSRTSEYRAKAFIAIQKSLTLNPRQVEALLVRGNMAYTLERNFDIEAAARDYRRALGINPRDARAHEALGALYHHVGLNDRALREFRLAIELDPASDFSPYRIPRTLMYQGRYAEALAIMKARPDRENNFQWPLSLWFNGAKAEALAAARLAVLHYPENGDHASVYALVLAGIGRRPEAEQQIARAIKLGSGSSHFHHSAYNIASAYALMGKNDQALAWLGRVTRGGMPNYELFVNDPNLNGLRREPGFRSFLKEQRELWEHYARVL